jgi:hypothetical protein
VGGRALIGGPGGVSDRGRGRTDRAGPAPEDAALTGGPGCRAHVREAVSRDLGRAIKIRRGRSDREGGERLRAVPLLFVTVKSPELGQARARVVPGSPGWVRDGENDSANSVAGLWPRIRGQRGRNSGEKASGGPDEHR